MASLSELRFAREEKLKILESAGMSAYPSKVARTHSLSEIKKDFERFERSEEEVSVAGRIMIIRGGGAINFVVLQEDNVQFQIVFKKDVLHDENQLDLFQKAIDMGDFISVTGIAFTTQKGEPSILARTWTLASKALLPLPEKWHGITDEDERFRKRYLDILTQPELYDLFVQKELFWKTIREFLQNKNFHEVETPTLEVTTGGAEANPFRTYHNDFDLDVFLRISVGELWQKRLMSAGFSKTFEIGRVYRNEGSSPDHVQEFTNMEFYWSFANYRDGMKMVTELYRTIAEKVFQKTVFTTRGHTFDFMDEWQELDYVEHVKEITGVDVLHASEKEMIQFLDQHHVKYEGKNRERLMDTLWKFCRKKISGPAFVVHHPQLVSPLSKSCADRPELTERFQVIIAGSEVGNGFSELNDPREQRERFEIQQRLIAEGDHEAMMPEWEFVEMLEHGMPPACGFGFGERLFAFLVDKPIREIQLFPLMKPRKE